MFIFIRSNVASFFVLTVFFFFLFLLFLFLLRCHREEDEEEYDDEDEEEEEETAALTVEARFLNIVQSMKLTHLETAALRLAIARSDTHIRSALEVFKATLNEVCVLYLSIYISIYLSIFLLVDDAI